MGPKDRAAGWLRRPAGVPWPVQVFAAATLLCVAGTFLAAQIDYFRRYRPRIDVQRYWGPQLTQIWAPGLGAAALCAVLALLAHLFLRRPPRA